MRSPPVRRRLGRSRVLRSVPFSSGACACAEDPYLSCPLPEETKPPTYGGGGLSVDGLSGCRRRLISFRAKVDVAGRGGRPGSFAYYVSLIANRCQLSAISHSRCANSQLRHSAGLTPSRGVTGFAFESYHPGLRTPRPIGYSIVIVTIHGAGRSVNPPAPTAYGFSTTAARG